MNRLNSTISKTVKIAFTVLFAGAFGTSVMAQNIHFGLKASPGVYWLSPSSDHTSTSSNFGFGYGAMLEFGMTDNYYIVTGVDVVSLGATFSRDSSYTVVPPIAGTKTTNNDYRIQYLQIPLMLKMKTNEIGHFKYFGQFGLGTGFPVSTKNSWTTTAFIGQNGGHFASSGSENNSDNVYLLREALLIGAGAEYNITGNTCIVASIMYDNGFTSVLRDQTGASGSPNPSMTSKGIMLTVGILF